MRTPPLRPSEGLLVGPRNDVVGGGGECESLHWSLRWSPPWDHEALYRVGETHADTASGAFGAAPYGATKP
eukprot:8894854-Pyramimonas_sp.AAC.1